MTAGSPSKLILFVRKGRYEFLGSFLLFGQHLSCPKEGWHAPHLLASTQIRTQTVCDAPVANLV
jgi:hypothetical protein